MKLHVLPAILCLAAAFLVLSGCIKVSPPASNPMTASEPLTGNWDMNRTSLSPAMPNWMPPMAADQIFPKSSTWSISSSGGILSIKYDGKATWFNPLGINVSTKPQTPSQAPDKQSCTFAGGGSINESKLPGLLSMASPTFGNPQDIAVTYTDSVAVKLSAPTQLDATITYSANGAYRDSKGPETFNYSGKLTYTGKRR